MRLIDADALVNELHKHFGAGFDEDEWWNSTHVLIAIEWTPTVDAIPVEFIEKEINMTKKGGADMYPHCLTVMLNRWKRAERKEE